MSDFVFHGAILLRKMYSYENDPGYTKYNEIANAVEIKTTTFNIYDVTTCDMTS